MTKLLNIASLAVAATAALHIKGPTGEPLYADAERTMPVRIHLHSLGSDIAGVVQSRQTARTLKRMEDNDGKPTAPTAEERKAETAADLATLTVRFENFEYQPEGAAEPLHGEALFRAVYGDQTLGFITKQVAKFIGDWGNFSTASTST
jgi:hypothetical protein